MPRVTRSVTTSHTLLSSVTADQHHTEAHALDAVAHTGTLSDAGHGSRTTANAHAHSALSSVGLNDHQHIEAKEAAAAAGSKTFTWTVAYGAAPVVTATPVSAQTDAGLNIQSKSTTGCVTNGDGATDVHCVIATAAT